MIYTILFFLLFLLLFFFLYLKQKRGKVLKKKRWIVDGGSHADSPSRAAKIEMKINGHKILIKIS